jgi:hypothetical protein
MAGVRHVWVRMPFSPVQCAGLVLGWRRTPDGWEGLVTFIEPQGRVVTDWLPADHLRPVSSTPGIGSAYG